MKRYELEIVDTGIGTYLEHVEKKDGTWVKYENAEALHEALTKLVECIEVIKFERRPDGSPPDWFDWCFINQELKKAKKILGGGVK